MKNPTGAHLRHMRIRLRSRAKVSVMVGFVVAALSIAAVQSWRENLAEARKADATAALARKSRKPAARTVKGRRPTGSRPAQAPAA